MMLCKGLQHEEAGNINMQLLVTQAKSGPYQKTVSPGQSGCCFRDLRGIVKLKDWQTSRGRVSSCGLMNAWKNRRAGILQCSSG